MKDEPTNGIPPLSEMTAEWLADLAQSTHHDERLIGFLTLALIESKLLRDFKTARTILNTILSLPDLPQANRSMLMMHQADLNCIRQSA